MDDAFGPGRMRPTVLVTGAETMLGANLAVRLAERARVVGFCRGRPILLDGCETTRWEPGNVRAWKRHVRRIGPQWILHCGGIAHGSWDLPETAPDGAEEARICVELARLAADGITRLTVVSTDAVFAGPRMFHSESSPAGNDGAFARAAREVEQALEATAALVVRTHAYGWSPTGMEPGFAERAWQALSDGLPRAFECDWHATPISGVGPSGPAVAGLSAWAAGGCITWPARERTSAYRFAGELAFAFGLPNHAQAVELDAEETTERCRGRLCETSLDTRAACRALEWPMPLLGEGLERFARQSQNGTRERLRAVSRMGDAGVSMGG